MTDCCSISCEAPVSPQRRDCPQCGAVCKAVGHVTVLHQVRRPWEQSLQVEPYYFCSSADCDLVYFNAEGARFVREQVRQPVGQKQTGKARLLCYCFGVSLGDWLQDRGVREFVIAQTKAGACACETRNPSGRCGLGDFPKLA